MQPHHVGGEDPSAEGGHAIAKVPHVVARRGATRGDLDQRLLLHAADVPVQIPRLQLDPALGVIEDLLTDRIVVALALGEHRQDRGLDRSEGQEGFRIGARWHLVQ